MLNGLRRWLCPDLAIDLGTANTLVAVQGRGIVLDEPSVVALENGTRRVLGRGTAVGKLARQMLGRTPDSITAVRPLQDGVITDFELCEAMLRYFINKACQHSGGLRPRVVIAIPGSITAVEVFTRRGCERIIRAAFEKAARRPRKRVASITKSNAQGFGMVLWDECFAKVAGEYPEIATESLLIDRAVMEFVRRPESFDVVVASNLFGDILTDLAAILVGSMGLAASGNIDPTRRGPSMFEPVHGSAPDIAGRGI